MKESTEQILNELIINYMSLKPVKENILKAFEILNKTYLSGGTVFICGNGGSAADSEHIVGELMKSFRKKRPLDPEFDKNLKNAGTLGQELSANLEAGIPAVSLCGHVALTTAFSNDKNPLMTYAQQLCVMGKRGDALITVSTSGNAKNCLYAAVTAKAKGISVILLSGKNGGAIKDNSDCSIIVAQTETYRIQELHLPVYHCLCAMLENENFN